MMSFYLDPIGLLVVGKVRCHFQDSVLPVLEGNQIDKVLLLLRRGGRGARGRRLRAVQVEADDHELGVGGECVQTEQGVPGQIGQDDVRLRDRGLVYRENRAMIIC